MKAAVVKALAAGSHYAGKGEVPVDVPPERVLDAIPNLFTLAATGALKLAVDPVPLAQV